MLVRRCLASECEFKVAKQVLPLQQTNIQFSQYVPKESYSAAVKYNSRGTTNSYKCVPLGGQSSPDYSHVTVNFVILPVTSDIIVLTIIQLLLLFA